VSALIRHGGEHAMADVSLSDGSVVYATAGHPFWDASAGAFVTAGGARLSVTAVVLHEQDLIAYNLSIEGIHTYYAGDAAVLVHNKTCSVEATSIAEHAIERGHSIPGVEDDALGSYIDDVIASDQSITRDLERGRTAFWDWERQTVVIRDPASPHGGTVYKPDNGFDAFLGLD
jgi:hypothetical protein